MAAHAFDDGRWGGPLLAAGFTRAWRVLSWLPRVARNRALLGRLGAMSERELADIGLTRANLRDATALPRIDDPSPFLKIRIAEGRPARGRRPASVQAGARR